MLLEHRDQIRGEVAETELRLIDQEGLIAQLRQEGKPTSDAESVFRALKESLETRLLALIRIQGELAALAD